MAKKAAEKELVELEKEYWQALKDRDYDAALRLTDEPCLITGPQGVGELDKKTYRAMAEQASYTLDDYKLDDDIKVRLLGDDVAILAYKVHEELTVDGQPVSLDATESSTWVRRRGRWVCTLHSEAIMGDPFGRDRTSTAQATA
jgi:ketosteroid isomerase-like protein